MQLRFVSRNRHKLMEANSILGPKGIDVVPCEIEIHEIQSTNTELLAKDKLLKAYGQIGRPLFVEHTGLYLRDLNGVPGGLTQIFWDALQADRFCELFGQDKFRVAAAKTVIAYCDGKSIRYFWGEVGGVIASEPRGDRAFQWDCVFVPDGETRTFAEMGGDKNEISMRRKALDLLARHLEGSS